MAMFAKKSVAMATIPALSDGDAARLDDLAAAALARRQEHDDLRALVNDASAAGSASQDLALARGRLAQLSFEQRAGIGEATDEAIAAAKAAVQEAEANVAAVQIDTEVAKGAIEAALGRLSIASDELAKAIGTATAPIAEAIDRRLDEIAAELHELFQLRSSIELVLPVTRTPAPILNRTDGVDAFSHAKRPESARPLIDRLAKIRDCWRRASRPLFRT